MTPITDDFKARVATIDAGVPDFNYAGEAYDAVVIAAMAAQVAGTTEPRTVAKHLNGVTIGPRPCQGIAGAKLAVKELNAAGGVLGAPVVWREGDDGADATTAAAQIAAHKAGGVHVLIGTSGSGVATAVIPEIRKHGMIMISPSNTAAALSTIDDEGLYFRTAPSDVLQARALADMIMRDGVQRVTLIGRKDAYGIGLVEGVQRELAAVGMSTENIQVRTYQIDGSKVKDGSEIHDLAQQTIRFKPDGVLVVGLTESADMIKVLADAGLAIRH